MLAPPRLADWPLRRPLNGALFMIALVKEILANPRAMIYAILVHVALAAVLVLSFEWSPVPTPAQPKVDVVKAVAVDEKAIEAELNKIKQAEAKKRKAEERKQRRLDRKARAAEKRRKAEEQRLAKLRREHKAEQRKQQALKKKRRAEEKRLAAAKAKKEQEVARLAAEQAALEKKRQEEERRLAAAEAKRKMEEEQRRKAAEAQKKRELEAAMRAEIAAEQQRMAAARQRQLQTLRGRYIADIANKVERNWLRPPSAKRGLSCKVVVKQIPGGEVINVAVTHCTGDEVFRRSVETAVYKASPLPSPPDPALFDREIVFTFKPTD
jgi:colicin import membrane protein